MVRFKFTKAERLSSKKIIQELFMKGSSFYSYPIKLFYLPVSNEDKTSVLISVPKRKLHKAFQRNKVKRRIREAYRLNKHILTFEKSFYLAIVYTSERIEPYPLIESKLKKNIHRLIKEIKEQRAES